MIEKLVGAFKFTIDVVEPDIVGSKIKLIGVFKALIPFKILKLCLTCLLTIGVITAYRRSLHEYSRYTYKKGIEK